MSDLAAHMNTLVIIPARGGSKGIPRKNIKPLNGKPLIQYSIDVARGIAADKDICISTDDLEIVQCVESYGIKVPFIRPAELATDTAGTYEVLIHALDFYEKQGRRYDTVLLLQNTSPFRRVEDVKQAMALYRDDIDMVVSVSEITSPFYNSFEEENGFLKKISNGFTYVRRQDAPKTYEYNGAIYLINTESLKRCSLSGFKRCVKYVMDKMHSLDLDTMLDWKYAEFIIKEGLV